MARTRVKSSNIEDISISTEDIAANSITDDKIISIEADKLTGTIDGPRLPATLPAIDGSALTIAADKLTGTLLASTFPSTLPAIDGSALTIAADKLTGTLLASTFPSTLPAIDGSALTNLPPSGLNSSEVQNVTVGGAVNGTISSIQLNAGAVQDSHISNVDAGKISGTLAHGISSGGELGFLNKSSWADNVKETINLNHSAGGIGKAVVRVYEEYSDPNGQGLVNTNDWDFVPNESGFSLNPYTMGGIGITPSATSGLSVDFTFDNYTGNNGETDFFGSGAYKNGVGYKITEIGGAGIAKIISTNGNVANCKIEGTFTNTNRLAPGTFKFEAGDFTDGNFQLSKHIETSSGIVPYYGMGEDFGGQGPQQIVRGNNGHGNRSFYKMVRIDDVRSLVLFTRTENQDNFQEAREFSLRVVQHDPNSTQGSGITENQEFFYSNTKGSSRFPAVDGNQNVDAKMTDVDICYMSSRGAVMVGRNAAGRAIGIGVHVPTSETSNPQSLNIDPTNQLLFGISGVGSDTKNVNIEAISDKHFYITWLEYTNFTDSGSGYVPYGRTGYMHPDGSLSYGPQHLLINPSNNNLVSTIYMDSGAGEANMPLLKFFDHNSLGTSTQRRNFVYIYYRQNGSPYAIHGAIDGFSSDNLNAHGTYHTNNYTVSPNQGSFRDSNNSFQPNLTAGNRIGPTDDYINYSHWIDSISYDKLVYFWRDSTLGVQAACVSLAPDRPDRDSSPSLRPIFFGEWVGYSSSVYGGPAQRIETAITSGVGSMSGAIYDKTTKSGYYQWSDNRSPNNLGPGITEAASDVIYGTFTENNTVISKTSGSSHNRSYTTSGDVPGHNVVAMTNNRLFSAHQHGDDNFYAKIYNFSSITTTYVNGEFVTTISSSDTLDTTNHGDITNIDPIPASGDTSNSVNNDSVYYSFSDNPILGSGLQGDNVAAGTFFITHAAGGPGTAAIRNIATSLSSIHGGTEGDWYYNASTSYSVDNWVRALGHDFLPLNIDKNTADAAITTAIRDIATNRMNGFYVQNGNNEGIFSWPSAQDKLAVAVTMRTTNSTITPKIDAIQITYNTPAVHRDKTNDYTIDIVNTGKIEVTSPSSGGPRNARVYITS